MTKLLDETVGSLPLRSLLSTVITRLVDDTGLGRDISKNRCPKACYLVGVAR